jgi:striatin 1/3/4
LFVQVQLLNTFTSEQDGIPSSVDFVRDEPNRIVAAFASSHCIVFDSETAKPIMRLESSQESVNLNNKQINKIVCHPTLPLTITAHEDRHVRFWDNHTGKMVHSMVAHLDAVTSLAVDPNGLYLLSGIVHQLLIINLTEKFFSKIWFFKVELIHLDQLSLGSNLHTQLHLDNVR